MGVGDSQETTYVLRGSLAAGTWGLRVLPVAGGITLHADVVLRPADGPERVLFSADSNIGPDDEVLAEGAIVAPTALEAVPAACGDVLALVVRLVASPEATHWLVELTPP